MFNALIKRQILTSREVFKLHEACTRNLSLFCRKRCFPKYGLFSLKMSAPAKKNRHSISEFQPTRKWLNNVNLSRFSTQLLFQIRACVISARKAKHLDVTTMFTYSHGNTPLGQSERACQLSYFITCRCCCKIRVLYFRYFL